MNAFGLSSRRLSLVFGLACGLVMSAVATPTRGDEKEAIPEVKIFSLVNSDAAALATMLDAISEPIGVRVSADSRSNSLVAVGTAEELAVIEAIILRIDQQPTQLSPVRPAEEQDTTSFFNRMLKPGDWVLAINHTGQDRYVLRVLTPDESDDEQEQTNLKFHNDAYTVATIGVDYVVLQNRRQDLMLPQDSIREIYRKTVKVDTARVEDPK